jgi:homoserine dehydrogenase
VSAGLVQPKAILTAKAEDVLIEVAALGAAEATTIADVPARKALPAKAPKLRVALLGCGSVGIGMLSFLQARPDLFDVNPVLVRNCDGQRENGRFTDQLEEALTGNPDIVVELLGGADYPAAVMCSALRSGAHVVTANKAAVAKHYDTLHACAEASDVSLLYSAAVGGGAPVLEALGRLKGEVVAIEGVMNGTANYLLGRLGQGWDFDEALKQAQLLGFAEADPSADVDGHDAADKLSILVRAAFGVALPPTLIVKDLAEKLNPADAQAAISRGEVLKQVGRCRLVPAGGIEAEVRVESLPAFHPLAGAQNEENRFLVTTADGIVHEVHGKGAGRWPTAASVFADVMDVQRSLLTSVPEVRIEPVLLRA